jgi:two-component system, chemotaxis family, response regulator Rcp1
MPFEILLVEDNPGDVRLIMEALGGDEMVNHLTVAEDGEQARDLLCGASHKEPAHVDLILLDLNLPGRNGREILVELKHDPKLKHIPVIILTSSESEEEIRAAYAAHASCYVTKPVGSEQFMRVIRLMRDFWLTVARLPGGEAHGYRFNSNTTDRG